MDKSSASAKEDNDEDKEHEEENDSMIIDQLLNVPSPPSESPNQETVATTGDSVASTWSAFSWFRIFQVIAEHLYIPQLLLIFFHMFQILKGKKNESKNEEENKIDLLLENDKSFQRKYKVDEKLGSGKFGIVYRVTPKYCDKEVNPIALKILCKDLMQDPETTLNEIKKNVRLCQSKSCPNVVSFFSFNEYIYQSHRYLCLEMELCDGGTLKKPKSHEHKYVTNTFRKKILEETISGMLFIHDCGVAHWDIHGGNILFKSEDDDTIKFGDFGLTRESTNSQDLDIQELGRTLLKCVFLRESDFSDWNLISIEFLLCEAKVQKDLREILEGLTFNTMSLREAQRRIIEIKEKDSPDGKEEPLSIPCATDKGSSSNNNISASSAVRRLRTKEEILKIDPFYPLKSNGELLQPEDLVHFIIVYPKYNYVEVKKFTSWFQSLIEEDTNIPFKIKLYDEEEFPADGVQLAKEIYDRAMFVLFYLTKNFHEHDEDMYPSFVSNEGVGQTKIQHHSKNLERHIYSHLAKKHKIDCRRPVHTMPLKTRNYETPSGLTTIKKQIDYFDIDNNQEYLEKTVRDLGRSAKAKLEDRKKAMKCLFEESNDVHDEKNDACLSDPVQHSMPYSQVSDSSLSSDHVDLSQTKDAKKPEKDGHYKRKAVLALGVSGPLKSDDIQRSAEIFKNIIKCFKSEATRCHTPLEIAKKCIGSQSTKKDVNRYLHCLKNSGFLEVVYSTEWRTDPRFQPTDKLNDITDERIAELASEVSGPLKSDDIQRSAVNLEVQNCGGGERIDESVKGTAKVEEIFKNIIKCFKSEATPSHAPLKIAKKCIGSQSTKKDVNGYLHCLKNSGFLEVVYSTERKTDPRFQPTDKLNDITDDRIKELASEFLGKVEQEDGVCIQQSMKTEKTKVGLLVKDVEIWFDYLSRKLPSGHLQYFCAMLMGDSTVVDSCSTKYIPDIFFKVMNSWKCKYPEMDHVNELKKTLSQLERQDLVEDMSTFSIQSFHTNTIEGPDVFVGDGDFRHISRSIAQRYVHVVRFLGLPQSSIDQIELNFASNIEEQIFQALKKIKYNFPALNRQQVCNALNYADHSDVILALNEIWRKSK